jgi:hypothetical protein
MIASKISCRAGRSDKIRLLYHDPVPAPGAHRRVAETNPPEPW